MNGIGYYFDIDDQDIADWIDQLSPEQKILLASGLLQVGLDENYQQKLQDAIVLQDVKYEPFIDYYPQDLPELY